MEDKLYGYMDWPGIEAIVYSEEDHPYRFLGPHTTDDGILILAFFPDSEEVSVVVKGSGEETAMVKEDEAGYYAVLLPGKRIPAYSFRVLYESGTEEFFGDPYSFGPQLTEKETKKFNEGTSFEIYRKLGAHPATINGVSGVSFAVWAPNAVRVSVVGDFDHWDGRMRPMERLWDSGIFELFIPGVSAGDIYKYEIKAKGGLTYLKADPYAFASELRPDTASIVADLSDFTWTDEKWLAKRPSLQRKDQPLAIYEVDLSTFARRSDEEISDEPDRQSSEDDNQVFDVARSFYNYRELAPMIAKYVKELGYTHIELLPVMEHFSDASMGYEVTGYYAPTARFGKPEDFMYFMNYMHTQGIGVILDWVPAQFPRDVHGLAAFDGTFLYEHMDPRKGVHPKHNTLLYNYARPEVSNFLIANALFWKDVYHADGLRLDSVATMLYLDYDRKPGQWIPNIYGGPENLDTVEFFKNLNAVYRKKGDGALLIAEDASSWPNLTAPVKDGGLGFDYKWNSVWAEDTVGYLQLDPHFRSEHYRELTQSTAYSFSENFITGYSHDAIVYGQGSMYAKMPGRPAGKYANLRLAYGYLFTHPGKKMLFMGQDLGAHREWNYERPMPWDKFSGEEHQQMMSYMKALLKLYRSQPTLYQMDDDPEGFSWINNTDDDDNLVTFMRLGKNKDDNLLVICNFSQSAYEKYQVGVPYPGKYKEIFNSDSPAFGGSGNINPRVKTSKPEACDGEENSIRVVIPPMGISVYSCTPAAV